jgi:hypothetical protein
MRKNIMYYQAVRQCSEALKNFETCLDKAEQYAKHKSFDVTLLLRSRLAPDMLPLIYQIQSACDYAKGGAAWLSGQTPPKHEDNEQTVEELRVRIRKTAVFIETVNEDQYEGAADRKVDLSWKPGNVLGGGDYLLQMVVPNVYFHLSMAYAILRNNGVDIGKMDFVGTVNFIEAC